MALRPRLRKKNWLGTNPVHAAAIVSIGAVVVPEEDDTIKTNIRTLRNTRAYANVQPIIISFPKGADALCEFIQTYDTKDQSTFFKTIRKITHNVPDQLLDNSDSKSEQTSGENTGDNSKPPPYQRCSPILLMPAIKPSKTKKPELKTCSNI